MTKTILALLVAALAVPAAQAADPVMPKDLPAYAADKPLPVPAIDQRTLDNGWSGNATSACGCVRFAATR